MIRAAWVAVLTLLGCVCAVKGISVVWGGDMPTVPGALNPAVTQATIGRTVCVSGWTTQVRPAVSVTNKIKRKLLASERDKNPTHYELDHLVSLQLGGAPSDEKNLWLEPYAGPCGARVKDVLETALKRRVCAGTMTLTQAQDAIRSNWVNAYNLYVGRLDCRN